MFGLSVAAFLVVGIVADTRYINIIAAPASINVDDAMILYTCDRKTIPGKKE